MENMCCSLTYKHNHFDFDQPVVMSLGVKKLLVISMGNRFERNFDTQNPKHVVAKRLANYAWHF